MLTQPAKVIKITENNIELMAINKEKTGCQTCADGGGCSSFNIFGKTKNNNGSIIIHKKYCNLILEENEIVELKLEKNSFLIAISYLYIMPLFILIFGIIIFNYFLNINEIISTLLTLFILATYYIIAKQVLKNSFYKKLVIIKNNDNNYKQNITNLS